MTGIPTISIETTSGGVIIAEIIAITIITPLIAFIIKLAFKTPNFDSNALKIGTSNKNL